jgi:hypothetical protein
MKPCNQCSLCCKLIDVEGLAAAGKWCPHCKPGTKGGGCTIHDKRPEICIGYNCLWRESPVLKEDFAPHRCGIVFEAYTPENVVVALVDKYKADAWKRGAPKLLITQMLKDGFVVWVRIGKDRHLILPKGVSQATATERTELAFTRTMRKDAK